ncbi:MAG: YihA family ribosome biogenesis GTP-binding protein [Cardiobacteriaceae bacterium]|nr:YihA family ribosome biogenesis GTP-binding protein [Cardiobacteriaceae bacterium]
MLSKVVNNNIYSQASFVISCGNKKQFPENSIIEVAFAGRSNAGKSSALNTLTNQKKLAKISKTPGRTQLINYFSLPAQGKYLVDLPGYGYAKVPEEIKKKWEIFLGDYILQRPQLGAIILLMDIRHPMKSSDIILLECAAERQIPVHILLTKADKLSQSAASKALKDVKSEIVNWRAEFSAQVFSSLKRTGLEELIEKLNGFFELAN